MLVGQLVAKTRLHSLPDSWPGMFSLLRIYISILRIYISIFTPNTPNTPFVGLKALILLAFGVGGSNPNAPPTPPTVRAQTLLWRLKAAGASARSGFVHSRRVAAASCWLPPSILVLV